MGTIPIRVFHNWLMGVLFIMFLLIIGGNIAIAVYTSRQNPQPDETEQDDILDSGLTREKDNK